MFKSARSQSSVMALVLLAGATMAVSGCSSPAEEGSDDAAALNAKRKASWEAPAVTQQAVGVHRWESESGGPKAVILTGYDDKGAVKYAAALSILGEGADRALVVDMRSPAGSRLTITKDGWSVSSDAVIDGPLRAALTAAALDAAAAKPSTSAGVSPKTVRPRTEASPGTDNTLLTDGDTCLLSTGQGLVGAIIRAVLSATAGTEPNSMSAAPQASNSLLSASSAFDGCAASGSSDGTKGDLAAGGGAKDGSQDATAEIYPCASSAYNVMFKCLESGETPGQSVSWWQARQSKSTACAAASTPHLKCHKAFVSEGWACAGGDSFSCTKGSRRAVL